MQSGKDTPDFLILLFRQLELGARRTLAFGEWKKLRFHEKNRANRKVNNSRQLSVALLTPRIPLKAPLTTSFPNSVWERTAGNSVFQSPQMTNDQ